MPPIFRLADVEREALNMGLFNPISFFVEPLVNIGGVCRTSCGNNSSLVPFWMIEKGDANFVKPQTADVYWFPSSFHKFIEGRKPAYNNSMDVRQKQLLFKNLPRLF